ncbi:MAG: substrate-binding domain-containing protein [Lachnospiraceae bacterium]|nr:substrate-binding domain-containing protein [Lachnospiraceae bacterium]
MKKTIALLLTLGLSISFGVCAGAQEKDSNSAETGKLKIVHIVRQTGDVVWEEFMNGATAYGEMSGNEVINLAPIEYDPAEQVQLVQDALAMNPDVIAITPIDPDTVEPLLKQARENGIAVITQEATEMTNHDYDLCFASNKVYGESVAENMAKLCGGEGDYVVVVGSLSNSAEMERAEAGIAYIKENYPDMNLVCDITAPVESSTENVRSLFNELLTTYPNLKALWTHEDLNIAGLVCEENGLIGKLVVIGLGFPSECRDYIESGAISMSVFPPTDVIGGAMCALGAAVANGEEIKTGMDLGIEGYNSVEVDGKIVSGAGLVYHTIDNLDEYTRP